MAITKNILLIFGLLMLQYMGTAQNSFQLLLERTESCTCLANNIIETSDGNYMGRYGYWEHPGHYSPTREHIITITPQGDTTTYPFYREADSVLGFTKFFQVGENPIRYFASATLDDSLMEMPRKIELFMLLDSNFQKLWEKQYMFSDIEWDGTYSDIVQLVDGSFVYARRPNVFQQYMYIVHLSANAEIIKIREYEGDSAGSPVALTYSPDSSSIWMHTLGAHFTGINPYCTVIELDGQLQQQRVMHYPRWLDYSFYAKVLPGNKLIASGNFNDFDSSQMVTYLVDTGLNVLASSYLTDGEIYFAATGQTVDYVYPNHIYTAGIHNANIWDDSSHVVLAKYNSNLELIYEKYIGDSSAYWLFDITATSDSGVLLQIRKYDYWDPIVRRKALLLKLTEDGILVGRNDKKPAIEIKDAIVYPNPGGNILYLRTALKNTTFSLYNQQGHLMTRQKIESNINKISTTWLPTGLYIWTLEKDSKLMETGKWIKQ